MSQGFGSHNLSRRMLLAGLLATAASSALANPPKTSVRPKPRKGGAKPGPAASPADLIAAAKLPGKISFIVYDAVTGQVLESQTPEIALPPASVTKAITSIYGLSSLGSSHRFRTRLIGSGPIKNGRLMGDLHLVGGGDPTLDTDALGDLARQLKEAGVREISGKTYVNATALPYQRSIDPGQPDQMGYNPSLSGLNLNYNRVFFEWKRLKEGYEITMDARAIKYRPRVAMSTMKVVERKTPVFAFTSAPRKDQWTVARRVLGRRGGRWLPVRKPEIYAAEVFQTLARSFGIELPEFRVTQRQASGMILAQWQSKPLPEVLRGMMKFSNNLTAEAVGVSASLARGKKPGTLRASGRMMTDWLKKNYGVKGAKFVDHSGLGQGSRLTASDMGRVLLAQGWNGALHGLMKKIDLVDEKGKPIKNSPIKVLAKTGTLDFVSALTGYVETPGGRRLAFVYFSADTERRAKIASQQGDRPKGARGWNKKSKKLQQALIERWAAAYDG